MSGAQRRAEEQGYYEVGLPARTPKRVPEPEVPIAEVCETTGHRLSATTGMKSCVCGSRTADIAESPQSLF